MTAHLPTARGLAGARHLAVAKVAKRVDPRRRPPATSGRCAWRNRADRGSFRREDPLPPFAPQSNGVCHRSHEASSTPLGHARAARVPQHVKSAYRRAQFGSNEPHARRFFHGHPCVIPTRSKPEPSAVKIRRGRLFDRLRFWVGGHRLSFARKGDGLKSEPPALGRRLGAHWRRSPRFRRGLLRSAHNRHRSGRLRGDGRQRGHLP